MTDMVLLFELIELRSQDSASIIVSLASGWEGVAQCIIIYWHQDQFAEALYYCYISYFGNASLCIIVFPSQNSRFNCFCPIYFVGWNCSPIINCTLLSSGLLT